MDNATEQKIADIFSNAANSTCSIGQLDHDIVGVQFGRPSTGDWREDTLDVIKVIDGLKKICTSVDCVYSGLTTSENCENRRLLQLNFMVEIDGNEYQILFWG